MSGVNDNAYRMANKVALNMRYVESTGDPVAVDGMVRDAFETVARFLEDLDAIELKHTYEDFSTIYERDGEPIRTDDAVASKFIAGECDMMHTLGLQEKSIAVVGTKLGDWNRQPVPFPRLGQSLDRINDLVTSDREILAARLQRDPVYSDMLQKHTSAFSDIACGLALIMSAIERMKAADGFAEVPDTAIAHFGASLICRSTDHLADLCAPQSGESRGANQAGEDGRE